MMFQNKLSAGDENQSVLFPGRTAFVIIDHQVAFELCFDDDSIQTTEDGVVEIIEAAETYGIPVITSLVKTNLIGSKLSSRLETKLPKATRLNRSSINPWNDSAFAEAVLATNRPCLVIAGISVETSLSFTALGALARGLDVFVIKDACLGYSEQSIATTFERLTQAGVVPVSWRQVILEWNQGNVDASQLRRIFGSKRLHKRSDISRDKE